MATRTAVMQKIYEIIGKRGQSDTVVDRALEIFAAVASHTPIPSNYRLSKSLPTAPNREPGKWEKITNDRNDREQAGASSGSDTTEAQKPRPKPDDKKDNRPINRMHWKVKHPDGRVFSYTMTPNGALHVSQVGEYQTKTYSLEQWTKRHHDSESKNKEETPMITKAQIERGDCELDRLSKAQEPRRWGQPQRSLYDPLVNVNATRPAAAPAATRPTTPAPNMAQSLRASRTNLSQMTGHEMAATKQGVDLSKLPAGTDLTRMDKGQMASLARTQLLEATEPMFRASGKLYRR